MYIIGICVPTSKKEEIFIFLEQWKFLSKSNHQITFFIHEDYPEKRLEMLENYPISIIHTSQRDIKKIFGDDEWIIPKKSGACRSFPMYLAWKHKCDYIITLDDDCYPIDQIDPSPFIEGHIKAFSKDLWFNTISGAKPRGFPYQNKGRLPVWINHGLWMEVPDLDGPTSLQNFRHPFSIELNQKNEVIPPGMFFPLCAMNVCYHRDAIPASYNLLMGLESFGLDRFDDIWSGLFLKRIADHLGYYITNGLPYIRHKKASNPFINNRKEALGIHLNEFFWEHIAKTPLEKERSIKDAYLTLAEWVALFPKHYSEIPIRSYYFDKLATAMKIWIHYFYKEMEKLESKKIEEKVLV